MKKNLKIILNILLLQIIILTSCNPKTMDDFFGIQMDPQYIDNFEIVSYSELEGAKYKSNALMNPLVYAYAEMGPNTVHIKIVNSDSSPLKINFNFDEFYLHLDEEKFVLSKGDRENYPDKREIKTNESIEFILELPSNFLSTTGMKNPQSHSADYTFEIWKGQNTLNIIKEKIKFIEVKLGTNVTVILKPIP